MDMYNMFTCSSPPHTWGNGIMAGCSQAWLAFAAILFLILVLRRQAEDGALQGSSYNWIGSIIGLIAVVITIAFTGQARWGLLIGIVATVAGGFAMGMFSGGNP